MADETIENLFNEEVLVSEAVEEMSKSSKEEVVIISGEEIPKRIYNLCINHYLSHQYGD